MAPPKEGIYDQLVTNRLREALQKISTHGLRADLAALDETDCPEYLSRHLIRQIKLTLRAIPSDARKQQQLALTNQLLQFLRTAAAGLDDDLDPDRNDDADADGRGDALPPEGEILRAIYRGERAPQPPTTPLSAHSLLMNALDEPRLGFELERELATSDRVAMLVSFIQWRGWQRLEAAFQELAARGAPVRILTTTYIGATDFAAIEQLARLPNVELRISLDGRRRRLHAKAWLFHRDNGFSSVYVGSANLSGPALEDGIEWTVKLSEAESPHLIDRFRGAFESLWCDDEFERFDPADPQHCARVQAALESARAPQGRRPDAPPVFFDLRPHPFQQATLDRLESDRLDRGSFRNLVVAPTGTGKTLIAAFDYARQPAAGPRPRLLFLAHREELLAQARDRFRHVLRDESFGDLLAGGAQPTSANYLFATIQSFRSRELLARYGPAFWDYAVLDEAHHVPADSYGELIAALQPRILLGLTATPERTDGESILPWFNHRIADEMRLWHAMERQYLVPFDYYGIHDGTDLSTLAWSRGAYATAELEQHYLHNVRRANLILRQFAVRYGEWRRARALGFCVSIRHAEFMAEMANQAGMPAVAVTSRTPAEERAAAIVRLRRREINLLFTVDLFNEGVDIPEADCVLFLRPTESATVFLQQLGRGLRLDTGKQSCLVLDFIGNQRREFRFDQRYTALFGGTRRQLIRELETGITRLPGNCYFRLDQESRAAVLANLKARLRTSLTRLSTELQSLTQGLGRTPSLVEFLEETGYDLADVFKKSVGGWTALLAAAGLTGLAPSPYRLERILHVDSVRRLQLHRQLQETDLSRLEPIDRRMLDMLAFRLLGDEARKAGATPLQADPALAFELRELAAAQLDRVPTHASEEPAAPNCPLFLHRQYMRDEVLVALGRSKDVGSRHSQTGCFPIKDQNTELFFVTLDKSAKAFSPTTRYEDFAVSRTRFHWQSQSTTTPASAKGQHYIRQQQNQARFLLFVRTRPDEPFLYLGPLRFVSFTGSRPMSIYWDLERPMPAWFFELAASLRAA